MEKDERLLLQRSFIFGLSGIVLCIIPLLNNYLNFTELPMGPITGVGIALQLFGLSIAVLVLRKKKIQETTKDKAKKMVLVLAVSLIYFFLAT